MEEDRIMDVQEENLTEPAEEKPDSEDIEVSAENEEAETAEAEPAEAEEADGEEPQPEEPSEETEGGTEEEKKGFFSRKKDKEKAALKQRVGELEDRVMRQMAEFDNFRKRTDKEKDQMFSMGEKNVLEKLLPIIDNFERGFDSVQPEDEEDAFVQGMRKIYAQLVKQMEDIGVTPIDAAGKEFDPNLHNAVMQVESEEYGEGKIVSVYQKGYKKGDRILREAIVTVAQ